MNKKIMAVLLTGIMGVSSSFVLAQGNGTLEDPYVGNYGKTYTYDGEMYMVSGTVN